MLYYLKSEVFKCFICFVSFLRVQICWYLALNSGRGFDCDFLFYIQWAQKNVVRTNFVYKMRGNGHRTGVD